MAEWIKRDGGADAEWRRDYPEAGIMGIVREDQSAPADRRFMAVADDVRGRRRLGDAPDLAAARRLVDEYASDRAVARRGKIADYNAERRRAAVSAMTGEGKERA